MAVLGVVTSSLRQYLIYVRVPSFSLIQRLGTDMTANFRDLAPEFIQALNAEIRAARDFGGDRYLLSSARELGEVVDGYLYQFLLDRTCFVPDEARVSVTIGQTKLGGTVVSIEGLEIVLSLETHLGDRPERLQASMTIDLTYILEKLRERLCTIGAIGVPLFDSVTIRRSTTIPRPAPSMSPLVAELNEARS